MLAMIDTAEAVGTLLEAGASEKLAKAVVTLVASNNRVALDQLATKDELSLEIEKLRVEIEKMRGDMNLSIEKLRGEMKGMQSTIIIWVVGFQLAIGGIMVAAIKLL